MTNRFTIELDRLRRDSHDNCCLCGYEFRNEDTSHSGYSEDGKPLYVGECCKGNLVETAVRNVWMQRAHEIPCPSATLWRYMEFAKFVAMLKDRAIYFSRADHLGDRFECAKGVMVNKPKWDEHYLTWFRALYRQPKPDGGAWNLTEEEIEQQAQRLLGEISAGGEYDRMRHFVSCWHESAGESEALWRLYCPPATAGVAIRTTVAKLNISLGDDPSVAIGRVNYVDFRSSFAGINTAIFVKRQSLSHEREVRAVFGSFNHRETDLGSLRAVELSELLISITPSPFAPPWFREVLEETMSRFGVAAPVQDSEILLEPFY